MLVSRCPARRLGIGRRATGYDHWAYAPA